MRLRLFVEAGQQSRGRASVWPQNCVHFACLHFGQMPKGRSVCVCLEAYKCVWVYVCVGVYMKYVCLRVSDCMSNAQQQ